jgi:hypothetical protein
MPPKRSRYNIVQDNLRNEAIMLQDVHIHSPWGR